MANLLAMEHKRLAELEAKDETKLTAEEKSELEELRKAEGDDEDDQDEQEVIVQTSVRLPQNVYERVRDAAKSEHISLNAAVVRALEGYANGAVGRVDPHQDLRSLCDLSRMHAEATHPQIKAEIVRRVKRQFGVDLNSGAANAPRGNGDDETRRQFEEYRKAGGKKFKDLAAWKQASVEARASALKAAANPLDRFLGFEF